MGAKAHSFPFLSCPVSKCSVTCSLCNGATTPHHPCTCLSRSGCVLCNICSVHIVTLLLLAVQKAVTCVWLVGSKMQCTKCGSYSNSFCIWLTSSLCLGGCAVGGVSGALMMPMGWVWSSQFTFLPPPPYPSPPSSLPPLGCAAVSAALCVGQGPVGASARPVVGMERFPPSLRSCMGV